MDGESATVAARCPQCGPSFLLAVAPLAVGYAVDVEAAGCGCDLTEEEYEELTDRAIGAYDAGEREV
jgi:hypothetical protein